MRCELLGNTDKQLIQGIRHYSTPVSWNKLGWNSSLQKLLQCPFNSNLYFERPYEIVQG